MKTPVVIDSSVAIKWFVAEHDSAQARGILVAGIAGQLDLIAPDFIAIELGNIVWRQQRFAGMSLADAERVQQLTRQLNCTLFPASDLLDSAFRLACQFQCTVYDMLYVALAVRENCPFVTADERLVNSAQHALPLVKTLANWP